MKESHSTENYEKEQQAIKKEIEDRAGKTTEQLYAERDNRAWDAIWLKEPDRIPLTAMIDSQVYTGVPNSAAYYDPVEYKRAVRKITVDFEGDLCRPALMMSGAALEALDAKNRLWPGGPLPPDYSYQAVEGEWMKEDEYDHFFSDPSDFIMRRYLPRLYGALAPLSKLPPVGGLFQGIEGLTVMFDSPEFKKFAESLAKAGSEMKYFMKTAGDAYNDLAFLGFPAFAHLGGGVGGAPFDVVSSFLRGMQGSMLDMFRRPEKLLRLCDIILEKRIAEARPLDSKIGPRRCGIPLWRGDKSFMSEKQFDKFYWPGLKKVLQATIDLGYTPIPYFEAEFGDRLERLLELPKGKVMAAVEYADAIKAKDILKGHTCVYARTPHSAKVWTLREVEECAKDLIDKCRKGGGLIVEIKLPDKGTAEGYKRLMDSIREYGRY